VIAAPLDALHARRALNPDPRCNPTLFEAGQRYLRRWHGSTLCGLASRANPAAAPREQSLAIPPLEAAARHRGECRLARERLGTYLARLVDAIVTEERTPLDVGRGATRFTE
jgi:hypothetical protein